MSTTISGDAGVSQVQDGSIGTADIANGAVTPAKLSQVLTASGVVTTTGTTAVTLSNTIPSWVKRVAIVLNGVSTVSTGIPALRLGTSGSVENTGYSSGVTNLSASASATQTSATSGFELITVGSASYALAGRYTLDNVTGNTWVISGGVRVS